MAKSLVVIGGGAAGFFCALTAAKMNPDLRVTIVEKSNKLLSKVRISGGGRCNVTHAKFEIEEVIRNYPRGEKFLKKCFHQFFTSDTVKWFEARGVKLKTETDGRMFPVTNSSQTIIECLLREANQLGVNIMMSAEVKQVHLSENVFQLEFSESRRSESSLLPSHQRLSTTDYICIATGGYPKSAMFEWLRELGHTIEDPVPSLFTFNTPSHPLTQLMGISVANARVKIAGSKLTQHGPLLITHWGLSGPVILKLSAWGARELAEKNWHFGIRVNWLPEFESQSLNEKLQSIRSQFSSQKISFKNPFGIPQRLWEFLVNASEISPEHNWADLPARNKNRLISNLVDFEMHINGKTTFKEEFVTAGGIRLSEIDANTMMSKKVKNLFFAGEVMDVDGVTGGFNFQHAWTSGYIAGRHIATAASS
jgi:predicted Rossmann fold flavoprotein